MLKAAFFDVTGYQRETSKMSTFGRQSLKEVPCPFPDMGPLTDWTWYATYDKGEVETYLLSRIPLPFSVMSPARYVLQGFLGLAVNGSYAKIELNGQVIDRRPSGDPFGFGVHVIKISSYRLRKFKWRSQELIEEKEISLE